LIQKLILKDFPHAQFILFGSSGASLAIQGSDIDVLVFDKTSSLDQIFHASYKRLLQVHSFSYVEKVVCQVPILKLREKGSGLKADITFNRSDGYKGVICAVML
jgi:DNA polymerase sigma